MSSIFLYPSSGPRGTIVTIFGISSNSVKNIFFNDQEITSFFRSTLVDDLTTSFIIPSNVFVGNNFVNIKIVINIKSVVKSVDKSNKKKSEKLSSSSSFKLKCDKYQEKKHECDKCKCKCEEKEKEKENCKCNERTVVTSLIFQVTEANETKISPSVFTMRVVNLNNIIPPILPTPIVPVILTITPPTGEIGATVTLTGLNFVSPTVTVGGIPAVITSFTSTTITFIVPPGLVAGTTYPVVVTNHPSGQMSIAVGFTIPGSSAWSHVGSNLAAFSVLANTTVTNTGSTVVTTGDVGAPTVTGFPPGIVDPPGIITTSSGVITPAQTDADALANYLASQPCTITFPPGTVLGSGGTIPVLTPGVYCFATSAQLTGNLTLDGTTNPSGYFIFKIGSTLTTSSGSSITLTGGAQACNVFFRVGSSATLGTTTAFQGTILAYASITLTTGATVNGRLIAQNGGVTLDSNNPISLPTCTSCP